MKTKNRATARFAEERDGVGRRRASLGASWSVAVEVGDVLTTVSVLAASVAALASLVAVRDARREREALDSIEWTRERRRAVEDLGEALLAMAAALPGHAGPVGGDAYTLARLRARYALNMALHPDIEYAPIDDLIEKDPADVTLEEIERALYAVFESHVTVGDSFRNL